MSDSLVLAWTILLISSTSPLTTTSPASEFWGIDQSITYGSSNTPILDKTAGIVDTGTTLILMATNAFDAYVKATGATQDQTTGLLTISNENFNNLESLFFNIGDVRDLLRGYSDANTKIVDYSNPTSSLPTLRSGL